MRLLRKSSFATSVTSLSVALFAKLHTSDADPRYLERAPLGHFEVDYHSAFRMTRADDYCSSAQIEPESPIDLRVSKAHASHGYDTVRISIVSYTATAPTLTRLKDPEEELSWDHSAPFQYRWTSQFDTGVKNARCVGSSGEEAGSLKSYSYTWAGYSESPAPDSKCLFDCQGLDECNFYSFYYNDTTKESSCELFNSCTECESAESAESVEQLQPSNNLIQDKDNNTLVFNHPSFYNGWTTTKNYGKSFIHTALVKIEPGRDNAFSVDGTEFNVKMPLDGSTAKFIVWGDPCISSKFVGCSFGKYFDSYEKSVNMINALAEVDGYSGFDGFIMLGDKCVYHGNFFLPLLGLTHLDSSFI